MVELQDLRLGGWSMNSVVVATLEKVLFSYLWGVVGGLILNFFMFI